MAKTFGTLYYVTLDGNVTNVQERNVWLECEGQSKEGSKLFLHGFPVSKIEQIWSCSIKKGQWGKIEC